jgi:hypothetical protein
VINTKLQTINPTRVTSLLIQCLLTKSTRLFEKNHEDSQCWGGLCHTWISLKGVRTMFWDLHGISRRYKGIFALFVNQTDFLLRVSL